MKIYAARTLLLCLASLVCACGAEPTSETPNTSAGDVESTRAATSLEGAPTSPLAEHPVMDRSAPALARDDAGSAVRERLAGLPVQARLAERLSATDFNWQDRCRVLHEHDHPTLEGEPEFSTRSLLPGDAVDGTTVSDLSFKSVTRSMRQFNGKYIALRLQQSLLDTAGIARVRNFIEEIDLLYEMKKELIGIEPTGSGRTIVSAIPSADDPCTGGYACAYLNSRRIEMVEGALTATDGVTAISHELNHSFDRLSAFLFTSADSAHSFTEVMDTLTFVYLQRDENPHPYAQGLTTAQNLAYRRYDRLSMYENYPGANWSNCVDLQTCDPAGDAKAQDLSVHVQAGVALRVFELYGSNQPLKRWLNEAQTLAVSRGYVWDGLTRTQRREFLIETLSRGAQANLSCFFDSWNWPVSTTLRATLTSLYGSTNTWCTDGDADGVTRQRVDCNDASASVKPGGTELASNGVDDDCDGLIDETVFQETADLSDSPAQVVAVNTQIKGNINFDFDRDWYRVASAGSPRVIRLYARSLNTRNILDVFNLGSTVEFQGLAMGSWGWTVAKVNLPAGTNFDFRIFGYEVGQYEMFVSADTALPVLMPDGWPVTYNPVVASNPSANQYVIPAPPIPSALSSTPGLMVRHWVSNFGFVGTTAASSSFTWNAPAGTNAKGLQYRSEFVTSSSGPPVWPLSQYSSLITSPTFTSQEVGTVSTPGATKSFYDNFTLDGAGTGITGSADSFRYSWVKVSGDANVIARVVSLENTSSNALAGIAIRENLNANARNGVIAVAPGDTIKFSRRTSSGGSTSTSSATQAASAPRWLRLQRSGNTFSAYRSTNGTSWTQVGSNTSITMGTTVYVGLAVTSASAANLATTHADAVQVTGTIVP